MKTTLITGANRGIGLEFARQYLSDGWRVIACSRYPDKSDALINLASKFPGLITIHGLNVTDHAQIDRLAQELADVAIDLLINNAGVYPESDIGGSGAAKYDEWIQAFQINTMGPLKIAEAFANSVARSKHKTIVTISSKMGSIADNTSGGSYLYRSTKAAVNMVVKSLSIDLKQRGVVAVVLNPGWVKTDMGGPNAMISVGESVTGMRNVIGRLTMTDTGKFINYDGQDIPW